MKILMSALACEPGKGSELEVGYPGHARSRKLAQCVGPH
jgi:hypothetical protein